MRPAAWLTLAAAAGTLAFAATFWVAMTLARGLGGFWYEAWRVLLGAPLSAQRILMGVAVVSVLVALALTPLAWAERRAARAYAHAIEAVQRDHPEAVLEPYEGDEGVGVAIDTAEGRVIILKPQAGVGSPQWIDHRTREVASRWEDGPRPTDS